MTSLKVWVFIMKLVEKQFKIKYASTPNIVKK